MINKILLLIGEFGFKTKFFWLFVLIFIASILEAVGIASILPLISVLLDESFIDEMPAFLGEFFRAFDANSHQEIINISLMFVIGLFIIKTIISLVTVHIQYSTIYSFQNKLAIRILRNFIKDFDFQVTNEESAAKITNTIHHEVHLISGLIANCTLILIDSLMVLFICVTILIVGSHLSMFIFALFGILSYLIIKITGRRLSYYGNQRLEFEQKRLKAVGEGVAGIREIKVFELYPWFEESFDEVNKISLNARKKEIVAKSYPRHIFEFFAITALFGFIIVWVSLSGNPISALVPIISVFAAAAFKALPAANRITSSMQSIKFYGASVDTIYGIISKWNKLEGNNKHLEDKKINIIINEISFDGMSFQYNDGKKVLENININIQKGSKTAIIGESGSGKSTLVNIICGLLSASSGNQRLNKKNVDYEEYKKILSGAVGYVSQKPFLFNATISQNISNFDEDLDLEKVREVLRMVKLDEFADYADSFIVGENFNNLSGGQAQRIAIARALYQNSQIIILDEPTSALDNQNKNIINEIIYNLDSTIVWISHDIQSIKNCDVIYELKQGTSKEVSISAK